jgi:hypothetical protein
MNTDFQNRLISFTESQEKRGKSYFLFFRNLTTVSIGLLGLLIGLKPLEILNQNAKYLFLLSIILIGLGILFSVMTQFSEISYYKQEEKVRHKQLIEFVKNPSENSLQIDNIGVKKIYVFSEIMTFVCLGLSILSLISYVYFLEFN